MGRGCSAIAAIVLALAGIVGQTQATETDSAPAVPEITAGKAPFEPHLETGGGTPVCESMLAAARKAFYGVKPWVDIDGTDWPAPGDAGFRWIIPGRPNAGAKADRNEPDYYSDLRLRTGLIPEPADLDGDGDNEVIVLSYQSHSWRGDIYELRIYESPETYEQALKSALASTIEAEDVRSELAARRAALLKDSILVEGTNMWVRPSVLHYGGAWYMLTGYAPSRLRWRTPGLELTRLTPRGRGELTCRLRLGPDDLGAILPLEVARLFHLLDVIVGYDSDFGTLQPVARLRLSILGAWERAVLRPWAILQPAYNNRQYVEDWLALWAYGSLGAYLAHEALDLTLRDARWSLMNYYRQAFGLEPQIAEKLAERNIDWLFRIHFVLPGVLWPEFAEGPNRRTTRTLEELFNAGPTDGARQLLTRLALEHAPMDRIEAVLTSFEKEYDRPAKQLFKDGGYNLLISALAYPALLRRFLEIGADVNGQNSFGKTPLMFAAHYNLRDAVEILLDAGANANARTFPGEAFVNIHQRTALMYAAENAGPQIIRLLLDRGADAAAVDSRRYGVLHYFDKRKPSFRFRGYRDQLVSGLEAQEEARRLEVRGWLEDAGAVVSAPAEAPRVPATP